MQQVGMQQGVSAPRPRWHHLMRHTGHAVRLAAPLKPVAAVQSLPRQWTPDLDRRARRSLLERERDEAINLAQVCAKRSKRLLARVEQLQTYAQQRRQAGDIQAVEATLQTQAQVQAILAKTISRAHNNYALAARLDYMIAYLQQHMSTPDSRDTSNEQSQPRPAAAGSTTEGADSPAAGAALPAPATGSGTEVNLLPGPGGSGVQEGPQQPQASSSPTSPFATPEQQVAAASAAADEDATIHSNPGMAAWTSATLGSMWEVADWGMASVDWADLVDPALAAALTGRERDITASACRGDAGPPAAEARHPEGASSGAPGMLTPAGTAQHQEGQHSKPSSSSQAADSAASSSKANDLVASSSGGPSSSEQSGVGQAMGLRPAVDDASGGGATEEDAAPRAYSEQLHSTSDGYVEPAHQAAGELGSDDSAVSTPESLRVAQTSASEQPEEEQQQGVPEADAAAPHHGPLTADMLQEHDELACEVFGDAPATVTDEWLQQAQAAASAAAGHTGQAADGFGAAGLAAGPGAGDAGDAQPQQAQGEQFDVVRKAVQAAINERGPVQGGEGVHSALDEAIQQLQRALRSRQG